MVVVPELTKDQTVSCNNHTDAASSAGAVSHAFEEKKAIPITDATGIVTPESSNAGRHGASLALRGFRRRWSSKQSEGSIVSPDPIDRGLFTFQFVRPHRRLHTQLRWGRCSRR